MARREAAAAFPVSELDPSINACADFEGYVNRKWVSSTEIPADSGRVMAFTQVQDQVAAQLKTIVEQAAGKRGTQKPGTPEYQVGTLYAEMLDESALDRAGVGPVTAELETIRNLSDIGQLSGFIRADVAHGGKLVFELKAVADPHDATRRLADVSPTALGLPAKAYYTDPEYADIVAAYRDYQARLLELSGLTVADARMQADRAFVLESSLADATLAPEQARDPSQSISVVTRTEAETRTPAVGWSALFDAVGLPDVTQFQQTEEKFFERLNELLVPKQTEAWKALLQLAVLKRSASMLSAPFRTADLEFSQDLTGATEDRPRWREALELVNGSVGMELGRLYVSAQYDPAVTSKVRTMITSIISAMGQRLRALDWMSDQTKQRALEKLQTMVVKVGHPSTYRDASAAGIEGKGLISDVRAIEEFNFREQIELIGKPVDRHSWDTPPQEVNAFYEPTENSITFPAAILQAPFFDPKADPALNYGSIGEIIGHEITHAFDVDGSQYDAQGNLDDWWTPEDAANFAERTSRLVTQYDAYVPLPNRPNLHVNGELTLGENIADLGGFLVAFDAFQNVDPGPVDSHGKIAGLTPEQRFFLGAARQERAKLREEAMIAQLDDPHAPTPYRVNGVVPNVPQFARTFGCRAGDPMVNVPESIVSIW
ncbi:MAG: M13 family metallopeptidase [Nocardiaceae bacterium]|nr:M13 family metallopeptidase [Nocardiaceae bacterium]